MSKKKDKERARRQRRKDSQNQSVQKFHRLAPHMKKLLRSWGCDLRFYDFLDSYSEKFEQISQEAQQRHRSLLGIHEVDEPTFTDKDWSKIGYGHMREVLIQYDDKYDNDYGLHEKKANLCGAAHIFYDSEGQLRTGIMIRQTVKNWMDHRDLKYVTKIAALLHEIGHVDDIEKGINFHIEGELAKTDIIEAEVHANLYALDRLAEEHLRQSYITVLKAIKEHTAKPGYIGEVCQKVLERHTERQIVDWQDVQDGRKGDLFSEADLAVLGEEGCKAIQAG